jgi:uncharacterized membrane protein (UPF0127 family)
MRLERTLVITSFALVIILVVVSFIAERAQNDRSISGLPTATLNIGDKTINIEIAGDESSRATGLSGRLSLQTDSGLLLSFDSSDLWGIWMKDMRFPIDIIWISNDGTIVSVEKNVSPDSFPKIFFPTKRARHVLETNAGFFDESGARLGDTITLPSVEK